MQANKLNVSYAKYIDIHILPNTAQFDLLTLTQHLVATQFIFANISGCQSFHSDADGFLKLIFVPGGPGPRAHPFISPQNCTSQTLVRR